MKDRASARNTKSPPIGISNMHEADSPGANQTLQGLGPSRTVSFKSNMLNIIEVFTSKWPMLPKFTRTESSPRGYRVRFSPFTSMVFPYPLAGSIDSIQTSMLSLTCTVIDCILFHSFMSPTEEIKPALRVKIPGYGALKSGNDLIQCWSEATGGIEVSCPVAITVSLSSNSHPKVALTLDSHERR